jgi:hypothetical protein
MNPKPRLLDLFCGAGGPANHSAAVREFLSQEVKV